MEGWVRIGTGTCFRKEGGAIQPVANHDTYPGLTGSRTLHSHTVRERVGRGVATLLATQLAALSLPLHHYSIQPHPL